MENNMGNLDTYHVIGIMSGTSMDGVDIAYCQFVYDGHLWTHEIVETDCIPYPKKWQLRLENLIFQNTITYLKTHVYYGHLLGELVNEFIIRHDLEGRIDFVVSHGQTVYHQPENGMTAQIGDGAAIAIKTCLPVVCDLRSSDIAAGGQGAPIVPIADIHLFPQHRFCLNLGGIANVSCKLPNGNIIGYDICGANLLLNRLANIANMPYDEDGQIAAKGLVNLTLLDELNSPFFFEKPYPKSLSAGWVGKSLLPILLDKYAHLSLSAKMRTTVEHIAVQIGSEIKRICQVEQITLNPDDSMLVTGGGAFNRVLMERISAKAGIRVVVPTDKVVKFKEALAMAFIGTLRMRQTSNCLHTVTGASRSVIGGGVYWG